MTGPVQITTITANSPPPTDYSQHSITITLNFDAMHMPHVDFNVVEKLLADSRWDEGRYPFYEEMLHAGLGRLIQAAVSDAVSLQMNKLYGNEMVQTDPNTQMSKSVLETQAATKGLYIGIIDSIKVAEIGRPVKE